MSGKRDISELKVKCDNIKRSCEWMGTIGTLKEHVAKCAFSILPCPNKCKKCKHIMRKDLNKHLKEDCPNRESSCEHCGEKGTHTSITLIHDLMCPQKPVSCPIGCSITTQRKRVREHITTECELAVIACKYKRLGCDRELKRKDMAAHEEDDKLHLRMAMDTTVKLTDMLERSKSFHFKLTNYHTRKDAVYSPCHYISPNGYRMCITVHANGDGEGEGTHVSVYICIDEGKYDDQLKWPFIGIITVTLLNQLEDKNHHIRTLNMTPKDNMRAAMGWGYDKFIVRSALDYDRVNNIQYLKDDTLCFKVSASAKVSDHKPWLE